MTSLTCSLNHRGMLMPYLAAAVILVGAVCALNLALTMAVIRRLRIHAQQFANMTARPPFAKPGTALPDFTATTSTGTTVSRDFFTATTLVGVFSTSCTACRDRVPEFNGLVRAGAPQPALAVVVGDPEEARKFGAELEPTATVLTEPGNGPVGKAFQVTSFPTFYLVDGDAVITAVSGAPYQLPAVSRA